MKLINHTGRGQSQFGTKIVVPSLTSRTINALRDATDLGGLSVVGAGIEFFGAGDVQSERIYFNKPEQVREALTRAVNAKLGLAGFFSDATE
jgi:hypothetical protein